MTSVDLLSPHRVEADRCTVCHLTVDRIHSDPVCQPLVFYIRQDPTEGVLTAKSPQLGIEVKAISSRMLAPTIDKKLNEFFNGMDPEALRAKLDELALTFDGELPAVGPINWRVPYQTKRIR